MRDLPIALAARGWKTAVMTPAYGVFADLPGAKQRTTLDVEFAGADYEVDLFEVERSGTDVRHYVLDHELFAPHGPGRIYTEMEGEGPFATDASKFAFFCAASATALTDRALPAPDVLHLNDWPAALVLLLRHYAPSCSVLRQIRMVFTIHNLAMQGVRPLQGDDSALESWFPELDYEPETVADKRWPDCVSPMAVAIRLADAVNTVSPSYAREILEPNDPARGFSGGEGLEAELAAAQAAGRLAGILNGCTYLPRQSRTPVWTQVVGAMRASLASWIARDAELRSAHYLADKTIDVLPARRPAVLLTSIGRIASQKTSLFLQATESGTTALEAILEALGGRGVFIMVGSGDSAYERRFTEVASRFKNFVFLNGYSESLADVLYTSGDLFLMPSSFEPCGIAQMLAMRAGQPCVVHGVGGLKDTVTDGVDGFVFAGATPTEQAGAFVAKIAAALDLKQSSAERWQRLRKEAAAARFDWEASAAAYETLYGIESD